MEDRPKPGAVRPPDGAAVGAWWTTYRRLFVGRLGGRARHLDTLLVVVVSTAILLYTSSRDRQNLDYFVQLADAFLNGRLSLTEGPSWLNELVPRDGVFYVVYPPMPAVLLLPFVAIFGLEFHQQVGSSIFGGIAIGLAWLVLGRFELPARVRLLLTAVFGFGTVFWFTAEVGSAWYVGHVVADLFLLAAILFAMDRRWPWAVGFCLGLAAASRLPTGLAAPGLLAILLGLGWPLRLPEDRGLAARRILAFSLGLAGPAVTIMAYNAMRFGSPLEFGYALIPGVLEDPIFAKHGILSIEHLPRHFHAIFLRGWNFVDDPPFFQPSWWGLSLFLTTPLFLWLAKVRLRDPMALFAAVATGLVLIPIVTHGNVGIAQFGYRFSLDVQPLLFLMLATVFARGMSRLAVAAAIASIAINAYAVWAIGIGFVAF